METLWDLQDLTVRDGARCRLGPLTCALPAGFTALTGPSGAGKSTLLHVLAGFERASAGRCERRFADVPGRLPLYWAPATDGLWEHLTVAGHLAETGTPDAPRLLDAFGLSPLADTRPARLSRGERHRVALARAFATRATVLLLDEPLAHVGRRQAESLWAFMAAECRQHGISLIYATHDPALIDAADHVLELEDGKLVQPAMN
jgi:ABC-type lipoprotein export system ATPase subunit